jgi:hypothetical protein
MLHDHRAHRIEGFSDPASPPLLRSLTLTLAEWLFPRLRITRLRTNRQIVAILTYPVRLQLVLACGFHLQVRKAAIGRFLSRHALSDAALATVAPARN